jgi:hypothetical protein
MDKRLAAGVGIAIGVILGIGGWYAWRMRTAPAPVVPAATAPPVAEAPAAPPVAPPPIRHPVSPPAASAPSPGAPANLDTTALAELLGQKAVLSFLQTDAFVSRLVATVDNLPRPHAAPRLWPVNPTPGRFGIERGGETDTIAARNAQRYTPFVRFVEGIDTPRAAALYRQHYTRFQESYADLGYPRAYFNDRLVEVIDHLLATPELTAPPRVRLTEVKGPQPMTQPWLHYEYADPALESLSSGQKILIRMGPDNARRLKVKLAEFRRLVAEGAATR